MNEVQRPAKTLAGDKDDSDSGHPARQTRVAVDLSEQVAAKTALLNAAMELAERVLPKLAE